jgi:hypothetical protein
MAPFLLFPSLVMAGLDPAIHVFNARKDVDAQHKAGHNANQ